jgi:hypothetical protein
MPVMTLYVYIFSINLKTNYNSFIATTLYRQAL